MVTRQPQAARMVTLARRASTTLVALLCCAPALAQAPAPAGADDAPGRASAAANVEPTPSRAKSVADGGHAGPRPADGPTPRDGDRSPQFLHTPPSTADAGDPLEIEADIVDPQLVERALLLFRTPTSRSFRQTEFRRSEPGPYLAVVDEATVVPPYLDYTIELVLRDGRRLAVFASRRAPHRVQIPPDRMDVVEQALAARVEGRRNVFSAGGEYVSFGTSTAELAVGGGRTAVTTVGDYYYRVEAGYTHRLLGWIAEFGLRGGVVRGRAPVPVRALQPGQDEDERFDVGLNYGSPWVRFRLADILHADANVLLSVNEIGFQLGAGGTVHLGDPYGSKLSVGVEGVQEFGMRFFTQLDIQAHDRIRVAPVIEVTNAPSADRYGLRVLGELGVNLGYGFGLTGRGGYQARTFTSGGPSMGGALSYAF